MISESIFSGRNIVVPMADVQHIEKKFEPIYSTMLGCTVRTGTDYEKLFGIAVVTSKTKWKSPARRRRMAMREMICRGRRSCLARIEKEGGTNA